MEIGQVNNVKYTLRSKDIPLVTFSLCESNEIDPDYEVINKVYTIKIEKVFTENKALFPKNFPDTVADNDILKWINRRKAPKNRQFVEKIMSSFDDTSNPMRYVDVSYALSLNDSYWITRDDVDRKWKDCNLYEHPFDEILSYVAFTGYSEKVSGVVTSPEITSSGALKKCWSNREDGIYLIKGDDYFPRSDGRSQATNEYYAAQVAAIMEFEHIDYDLEEFRHRDKKKDIVCKCKLFTTEDEGFVDAATYYKSVGFDIGDADLGNPTIQIKLSKLFDPEKYADMMLFDSLIANQDRHLGNFGMIVDNNTGKYLRPAPIFDNGFSLLYGASTFDLKKENIDNYFKSLSCKFMELDAQAKLFVRERHIVNLRKLLEFKFKKHSRYNIEDKTLNIMSNFVQQRAARTIELYHNKINEFNRVNIYNKIVAGIMEHKSLDKIEKEILSEADGSMLEKKIHIKSAIKILQKNPQFKKIITEELNQSR